MLGSLANVAFDGQTHLDTTFGMHLPLALFIIACTQCSERCPSPSPDVLHDHDQVQKDITKH